MYGTREDLCRMLNEQYPAETPLNLIIWTPADIEALADGMEYSFSEHDVRAVLERMDAIPEEQRLESGVLTCSSPALWTGCGECPPLQRPDGRAGSATSERAPIAARRAPTGEPN